MNYNYPRIRIFNVNDSGELEWNDSDLTDSEQENEEGKEMADESSQLDSVFICLKNVLINDNNLTNYSRYIDFGKIFKITSNGSSYYRWQTEKCFLNEENLNNNSQLIRIVRKIDTKFLTDLYYYQDHIESNARMYNSNITQKDILFNIRSKRYDSLYRKNLENYQNLILQKMVNVDCKFKIKGTSLTVFDFVGKNLNTIDSEENFLKSYVLLNLSKIILVGDKGYIFAIIDRLHHVFISAQILKRIYDLDTTPEKSVFAEIIRKLFTALNTFCCYMLTTTISNYFSNQFTNSIIKDIFYSSDFNINDKMMLYSISNFKFSENPDTNNMIRDQIRDVITRSIANYINNDTYIDCLNIQQFMSDYEQNIKERNKTLTQQAFKNGLSIGNIFLRKGWTYVSDRGTVRGKYSSYYLENEHIYFSKILNEIPRKAVLRRDGQTYFRRIKDSKLDSFKESYNLNIYNLIFDITTGTLLCDANHPNVSRSAVCMGDLKGKVTFEGKSESEIEQLIDQCEDLLRIINYTSSYSDSGLTYFLDTSCSENCDSMGIDNQNITDDNQQNGVAELETASISEFEDESSEQEESNTTASLVDRESVNDENDYEEEDE